MVERLKGYSYSDRLRLLLLGLTTLETRFLRADLIEVFKFGDRLFCLRFFSVVLPTYSVILPTR